MENLNWESNETVNKFVLWFILLLAIVFSIGQNKTKLKPEGDLVLENPPNKERKTRLSVDELRSFKGLGHLSDEKANEAINTLEKYSTLIYELYIKHKTSKNGKC